MDPGWHDNVWGSHKARLCSRILGITRVCSCSDSRELNDSSAFSNFNFDIFMFFFFRFFYLAHIPQSMLQIDRNYNKMLERDWFL